MSACGDDWSLWQRARTGDEPGAAELVRLLTPQALGLASQLLRRREDAEDAVQEAFLRLWRSSPSAHHGSRLATYFNTIVINRCRTRLSSRHDLPTEDDTLATLMEGQQGAADAGAAAHPMSGLSHESTKRKLLDALSNLPARQRMALAMWAYADASIDDIAKALDLDVNAAHQLLYRARRALRATVEGEIA